MKKICKKILLSIILFIFGIALLVLVFVGKTFRDMADWSTKDNIICNSWTIIIILLAIYLIVRSAFNLKKLNVEKLKNC